MNKKSIYFAVLAIVILAALFSPTISNYWKDKSYYANNFIIVFPVAEFSIVDKFVKGDSYYLKLTINGENFHSKYNVKDKIKEYSLGDNKELFDKIDINSKEYTGINIQAVIPLNQVKEEVVQGLRNDPFSVISKDEYNSFVIITDVY